ncbi:MBL fold metallo-hydrolase [Hominifimenecus sp. rT4P-3]|uniref:MBL fold metallo-hydrolase n=1 Tax=Hominifimenecus sp. rT4P-3 TaxID=3242979 RepID=UPI003DA5ABC7
MRLVSLASGSSGNCIYIGSENHHILIDTGIGRKRVEEGLAALELSPADLEGVLVTHEHSDHVSGLGVLARKYEIPIYGTAGTLERIQQIKSLGAFPGDLFHSICAGETFCLGDLEIQSFSVDHDAADPVAYRVNCGGKSVAVVTDLGEYHPATVAFMADLDALLLEANHDVRMLQVGPYPYYLKQRVMGKQGHLSNETAGRLLAEVWQPRLRYVLLGHLSKENNYAELAYETVRMELLMGECGCKKDDVSLAVAPRSGRSNTVQI